MGIICQLTALIASPSLFSCIRASKAVFLLDILNEYSAENTARNLASSRREEAKASRRKSPLGF